MESRLVSMPVIICTCIKIWLFFVVYVDFLQLLKFFSRCLNYCVDSIWLFSEIDDAKFVSFFVYCRITFQTKWISRFPENGSWRILTGQLCHLKGQMYLKPGKCSVNREWGQVLHHLSFSIITWLKTGSVLVVYVI